MLVATPTKTQLGRPSMDSDEDTPILSRKRPRITHINLISDDSEDEFDLESTQKIKRRAGLPPDSIGETDPHLFDTPTTPVGSAIPMIKRGEC